MVTVVDLSTPALLREKEEKLFAVLRGLDRLMVAYSGGADSAYLAWAAHQVLGDRALAITADSASMPDSHKRDAERFVWQFGIPHEYVQTHEFDNPDYLKNDANRCFHCKDELFVRLEELGRERGIPHIVYGVNADDLGDYRPGQNAAKQHQVKAPLVEAAPDQGRDSGIIPPGRFANVGSPRVGLPELPHPLRNAGDHPERQDRREWRRTVEVAWLPPIPRALPRRAGPPGDRRR